MDYYVIWSNDDQAWLKNDGDTQSLNEATVYSFNEAKIIARDGFKRFPPKFIPTRAEDLEFIHEKWFAITWSGIITRDAGTEQIYATTIEAAIKEFHTKRSSSHYKILSVKAD